MRFCRRSIWLRRIKTELTSTTCWEISYSYLAPYSTEAFRLIQSIGGGPTPSTRDDRQLFIFEPPRLCPTVRIYISAPTASGTTGPQPSHPLVPACPRSGPRSMAEKDRWLRFGAFAWRSSLVRSWSSAWRNGPRVRPATRAVRI
jgi:hypothetical protein